MATTTIGSNPGFNDWLWDASMHQAWVQTFTPGTLGRMVNANTYCAGVSAGSGGAVAWINGNPAFSTTTDGVGAGNTGTGGGGGGHTTNADYLFGSGDSWEFGCYVSSGCFINYHDDGGASFLKASAISNTSGGTNFSAYAGRTGSMRGWGTYFIVETYVRRGGAWVKVSLYVRRGSGWNAPDIYVRRGGGWTQVGELIRRQELDWKRHIRAGIRWPDGTQERALLVWDYDRPRYGGSGYPGDPRWRELPVIRPYELRLAA